MLTFKTPYKDYLPPLPEDTFEVLKASIEAEGILHPILVDEHHNILDGHHRYKIKPDAPFVVRAGLSEAEKVAFVISSQDKQRRLTKAQQKGLLAKKKELASALRAEGKTQDQIAGLLGVSQCSISNWISGEPVITTYNGFRSRADGGERRRGIGDEKRAEIVQRLRSGETARSVADKYGIHHKTVQKIGRIAGVKASCKPDSSPSRPRGGNRFPVPEGSTPEGLCRKGLALEATGKTAKEAAKDLGIGILSYRAMRPLVLLADRKDLSTKDAEAVSAALAEMNEYRLPRAAAKKVDHIIKRIWGTKQGRNHDRAEEVRLEKFDNAFGILIFACETADEIKLPHLSRDRCDAAYREIDKAIGHLRSLKQRIREIQS